MSRFWCERHEIMVNAYASCDKPYTDEAIVRFRCGCFMKKKDAQKVKVTHKITYFLPDGREIIKVVPLEKPYWALKEERKE